MKGGNNAFGNIPFSYLVFLSLALLDCYHVHFMYLFYSILDVSSSLEVHNYLSFFLMFILSKSLREKLGVYVHYIQESKDLYEKVLYVCALLKCLAFY